MNNLWIYRLPLGLIQCPSREIVATIQMLVSMMAGVVCPLLKATLKDFSTPFNPKKIFAQNAIIVLYSSNDVTPVLII